MTQTVAGGIRMRGQRGMPESDRWARLLVLVIAVAAFGPYLFNGVRTEQLAVYGALLIALLSGVPYRTNFRRAAPLLIIWVSAMLLSIVAAYQPPPAPESYRYGSVIAGLDNYAGPIALIITIAVIPEKVAARRLLVPIAWTVVVGSGVSAIIAAISLVQGGTDWFPLLSTFRGATSEFDAITVAGLAEQNSRYTGIFNQPAEAGLVYSFALLLIVYLNAVTNGVLRLTLLPLAVLVVVGGIVCISKVFLLVGAPVSVWLLAKTVGLRISTVVAIVAALVGYWGIQLAGYLPAWRGAQTVAGLFSGSGSNGGLVHQYSAARLGSGGTTGPLIETVLQSSPWFGYGAGGLSVPYDMEIVEAIVVGGVVGALILAAIYATLIGLWASRKGLAQAERALATGTLLVVLGGSLGLPALTANRASTIAWLVLGIMLVRARPQEVTVATGHSEWKARGSLLPSG